MSPNTKSKTEYKNRTAALVTVFGLIPAAIIACPNLPSLSSPQDVARVLFIIVGVVGIVAFVVVGAVLLGWLAIEQFKLSMIFRRDAISILDGEQVARWEYGPGEWQQSYEAKAWARISTSPTPWVFFGPYGVYQQVTGFKSIRYLRSVNYRPPKEPRHPYYYLWGTMGRLEFVLNEAVGETRGRPSNWTRVQVGIPHGKEAEAVAIMNLYINERLNGVNEEHVQPID